MKTFFRTVKSALSSHHFYLDILKGDKPIGFLYTFILQGFVALVITIFLSVGFFAGLPVLRTEAINAYPADLEFTLKGGQVSINQPSPYFLFEKAVVIDTTATADIETLESYKVDALVTKTAIISKRDTGKIEIMPLKDLPDFSVDKAKIISWVEKASAFAPLVPPILFFSMWLLTTVGIYISSLVYALIVWLVLYLLGHDTSYRNAYSVTLYTRTIPSVLKLPFLPSLLIVVIVTLIAYKKR